MGLVAAGVSCFSAVFFGVSFAVAGFVASGFLALGLLSVAGFAGAGVDSVFSVNSLLREAELSADGAVIVVKSSSPMQIVIITAQEIMIL